ncbi:MAG: O-antigen ligase family protein [Elusimicrobia bacterium]|nr:O-antigen ligase family protein [Elusimicrobiota bacterium]
MNALSASRRHLDWALAALLVAVILIQDPGTVDYQLPKAALLRVGVLALLAAWLYARGPELLDARELDRPVLAYAAAGLLFTALTLHPYTSFFGRYGMYIGGLWTMLSLSGVYWLASRLEAAGAREALFRAAVAAGAGSLAWGFFFSSFVQPLSTLGSPLNYGGWLAMLIPLWICGLWRAESRRAQAAWLLLLAVSGQQILATLSRGAWLGALTGAALWLWLNRAEVAAQRERARALGAVLGLGLAASLVLNHQAVRARVAVFLDPSETSASARLGLWAGALQMMRDQKGWGAGLDSFGFMSPRYETVKFREGTGSLLLASYAHNELLQVGVTMGILGLAAYAWLWASLMGMSLRRIRESAGEEKAVLSAFLAAVAALWVHGFFNFPSLGTLAFQWAFIGALASRGAQEAPRADARRLAPALAALCLPLLLLSAWRMGRDWLADRAVRRGYLALKAKNYDAAAAAGERALALNPWGSDYATYLSRAYRGRMSASRDAAAQRGDLERAIMVTRDYTDRQALDPDGWHNYAMALMWSAHGLKEPVLDEALRAERRALELAPGLAELWHALGEIEHFKGDVEAAKKSWVRAVAINPGHRKANSWLERYTPRDAFAVSPPDLADGQTLKIVNLTDKPLRFEIERVSQGRTLYRPPEGYVSASARAELRAEPARLELGPNQVGVVRLEIERPRPSLRRRLARRLGRARAPVQDCFFVRIRCTSFDVPVDKTVRVLARIEEIL